MQLDVSRIDVDARRADVAERRARAWCAWFDALAALGGVDAPWPDVRAMTEAHDAREAARP